MYVLLQTYRHFSTNKNKKQQKTNKPNNNNNNNNNTHTFFFKNKKKERKKEKKQLAVHFLQTLPELVTSLHALKEGTLYLRASCPLRRSAPSENVGTKTVEAT